METLNFGSFFGVTTNVIGGISTFLSKLIGYHAQFELIYILGVFLFVSYLALILFIKNKKLY